MFCCDTIQDDTIAESGYSAWDKSLVRNVVQVILKFLRRIQDGERAVEDLGSAVSKTAFFEELAKTMMTDRRSGPENQDSIMWLAQRSRRYGYQFQNGAWCFQAAYINIQGRLVPPPAALVTPATNRSRIVDNPMTCLKGLSNQFPSKWGIGLRNICRGIALRIMVYHKRRSSGPLPKAKYYIDECKDMYQLCQDPDLHLRQFFFSSSQYRDFLKNTYQRSGNLLDPEHDGNKTGNRWLWEFATYHSDSWDMNQRETQLSEQIAGPNPELDQMSLDELSTILGDDSVSIRERMTAAHKCISDSKVYSKEYIIKCHEEFIAYRDTIVHDFRIDPDGARQKHCKKRRVS